MIKRKVKAAIAASEHLPAASAHHHRKKASTVTGGSIGSLKAGYAAVQLLYELGGSVPEQLAHESAAALEQAGRRALQRGAFVSARRTLLRAVELRAEPGTAVPGRARGMAALRCSNRPRRGRGRAGRRSRRRPPRFRRALARAARRSGPELREQRHPRS